MMNGDEIGKLNLTRRELEVLLLLASGLSNNEISNNLYISNSTLRSYLNDMYKKISVAGRGRLIIFGNSNKDAISESINKINENT